jgi:hypothetical protein
VGIVGSWLCNGRTRRRQRRHRGTDSRRRPSNLQTLRNPDHRPQPLLACIVVAEDHREPT